MPNDPVTPCRHRLGAAPTYARPPWRTFLLGACSRIAKIAQGAGSRRLPAPPDEPPAATDADAPPELDTPDSAPVTFLHPPEASPADPGSAEGVWCAEDGVWVDGEFLAAMSFANLDGLVRDTAWTWPNWVPESYITVVAGDHGAGKTWLALAMVRSVIHGVPWPDGQPGPTPTGPVFWLEAEQRHSIVRKRLRALGIDSAQVKIMPDPFRSYYVDRGRDFRRIAAMVRFHRPRMVVVDAWSKALAGRENDSEVRFCLDWLQRLAADMTAPVVLIHHVRKAHAGDWAEGFDFDRLRGSSVLAQVAVSVIGVDQSDRRSEHRRVSAGKATLAPLPEPLGFRVQGRVDLGEPVRLLFGPPPGAGSRVSRLDEACRFLRRALADGPRPASEVKEEAKAARISEGTLIRAKNGLCKAQKLPGPRPVWVWSLLEPGDGTLLELR